MSEPRAVEPISYARAGVQIAVDVRPAALLVPNIAAIATIFLKLTETESPFDAIISAVRTSRWNVHNFWDGMLTAPFLLSIPLAFWTARLCKNPFTGRTERIIAWCISASSMVMTLLAIAYGTVMSVTTGRFVAATIVSIIALTVLGLSLLRLQRLFSTYVPVLIGMTGSFAINTLLTILIVMTHSGWRVATFIDLALATAQLAAMAVLVRKYRRAMDDPIAPNLEGV
jgi:hypothetical protein